MAVHSAEIDRVISPLLREKGTFEPWETELVQAEIRPGDVVVDVGANIGYYTLLFARLVGPSGKVFAFEPEPLNFALLTHNVQLNGYANVVPVNKAVADRAGQTRLYLCDSNAGDHRTSDSGDGRPFVTVPTVDLDSYFRKLGSTIDFIKFDIQGAEWAALHGMRRLLARHSRLKMVTEFWPYGLKRAGVAAADYLALLRQLGFELYEIDEATATLGRADSAQLLERFDCDQLTQHTNLLCVKLSQPRQPMLLGTILRQSRKSAWHRAWDYLKLSARPDLP